MKSREETMNDFQIEQMNVKEALERLSLPGFFNDKQRLEAYYTIMENGNAIQKVLAEKTVEQYPLTESFLAAA